MGGINVKAFTTPFELKWMYLPNKTKAKKAKSLDTIMKNLRTYGLRPGENPEDDGELNYWNDEDEPEVKQQQQVVTEVTNAKLEEPNVVKLKPVEPPKRQNSENKSTTANKSSSSGTKVETKKTAKKITNSATTEQSLSSLR